MGSQVVVDLSRAAAISDMRPNRLAVIGSILQASALPSIRVSGYTLPISAPTITDACALGFIVLSTQGNAWQLSRTCECWGCLVCKPSPYKRPVTVPCRCSCFTIITPMHGTATSMLVCFSIITFACTNIIHHTKWTSDAVISLDQ